MATAVAVESPVKITATKLLINNQWVNSASGKTFPTINPSTGEEICQIAEADAADVDRAVKAARARFRTAPGARCPPPQRGVLHQQARRPDREARRRIGASLESLDNGKPYAVAARRRPSADHRLLSATMPAGPTKFKAKPSRSAAIISATRGMSRWAWSDRLFPGIFRC